MGWHADAAALVAMGEEGEEALSPHLSGPFIRPLSFRSGHLPSRCDSAAAIVALR